MSIEDKKNALVDELMPFEDHFERFAYIIDRAKSQPPLADEYKIDAFLIEGCLSRLWVYPEFKDGKCYFHTDSDAAITKGTSTLLCSLYSDERPEDIIALEPDFLAEVGVTQHLSPNRRNGLTNVRTRIKSYAELCLKNAETQ
ncbi:SufE family protein [Pelagicoccus sp. SDUM812003]|uniref:SufE family protein n=1 Tax=Pelagicoccus sp. SDUM812003 TaxID=3041267 RepID=UPI002810135D|nr:SufE family protein [Pelagicoccus sp. SDUM812003]MDQ8201521.1 SufE family protein [Pelagicoccus sp. SDUM812003]